MHRRSKVRYGLMATALSLTLTACGGSGESSEAAGGPQNPGAGDSAKPSAAATSSAPAKVEWSPALTMGQPAAGLYESPNASGGKFEIAPQKIVAGKPGQLRIGEFDVREEAKGTPYFIFVKYTLKEGKPASPNPLLSASLAVLDENGEKLGINTVDLNEENGCTVPEIYLGWDAGEARTLCSTIVLDGTKQPARLAWHADAVTPDDYKKGPSWTWTTQ
ncbi:hypothetical protein [Streptomyces sp. NPDC054952]